MISGQFNAEFKQQESKLSIKSQMGNANSSQGNIKEIL
jgi:hypothetical protein